LEEWNMSFMRIRPKVYTVAEFARVFAISPRLARDLIRRGELPALRIGRSYRIPRKAAEAYLARALPLSGRPASKSRPRDLDDQTGFLFPIGTLQ
jgi:excisionase family DNA binding protein